ncbi:hypothetical protein [Mycobacterium gordonae]|uniref:hypothetical protein n=1 Tax=Mycobacterium gordonae TaxID=1778 RepID=UPI000A57C42B|nr:hypothetical protein [Mycobacterium gordonae]
MPKPVQEYDLVNPDALASVRKTLDINRGFTDLPNDTLARVIIQQLQFEGWVLER